VTEHDDLARRLAEMGHREVDPDVAARHLASTRAAAPRSGGARRLRPVAAAAAAAVVLAGAGVAAAALGGGGERPSIVVAEAPELPDEAAVDEVPVEPPVEVPRPEEAIDVELEEAPAIDDESDDRGPGRAIAEARQMLRDSRRADGCTGPPEWAGTPAEPGVGRSEQARAHAALRAACGGGDDAGGPAERRGPPPWAGPPAERDAGAVAPSVDDGPAGESSD